MTEAMLSCALSKRLYHTQVSIPEVIDRRHTYAAVREKGEVTDSVWERRGLLCGSERAAERRKRSVFA